VLCGFDRLVFRGHLRGISYVPGMERHLWANQVLKKEFGEHAGKVTERLKEASLAERAFALYQTPQDHQDHHHGCDVDALLFGR